MRQQNKPDEKVPFWGWIARVHMLLKNVWQIKGFKSCDFVSVANAGVRARNSEVWQGKDLGRFRGAKTAG
jgi:hypothetical protein